MTVQQKQAWFTLTLCVASLALFVALVPHIGPLRAYGAFAICGLAGVSDLVSWLRGVRPLMDERDLRIRWQAQLAGFRIFWVCFVSVCMIVYAGARNVLHTAAVPVDYLPLVIFGAWVIFMASSSVATLVLYGRSMGHEE